MVVMDIGLHTPAHLGGAVAQRIAAHLRTMGEKECALALGADLRTVRSWRAGQLPGAGWIAVMVARWGQDWLLAIFADVLAERHESVMARLERVQADLSAIREMERMRDGRAGALAPLAAGGTVRAGADADRRGLPAAGAALVRRGRAAVATLAVVIVALSGLGDDDVLKVQRRGRQARPVRELVRSEVSA